MTPGAMGVEVGLASLCVSGDYVQDFILAAQNRRLGPRHQECGYVLDLGVGQADFRHAFVGPALQNNGADSGTRTFVVKNQNRPDEIGSAISPLSGRSVAEPAIRDEYLLASRDRRRIRTRRK